jgi:OmpA-OmpF porin, OOP family
MTGQHRAALLVATVGLILSDVASADVSRGFYFGLTAGSTSVDTGSTQQELDEAFALPLAAVLASSGVDVLGIDSSLDDSDIGWGVQVGYRFNSYLATEVGYVDLGEALYEATLTVDDGSETFPVEVSSRLVSAGPTAAVMGILPVGERFDVHAKAGAYLADTRLRARVRDVEFAENIVHQETDAGELETFFGVGGAWNLSNNYSLRFEYQRFFDVGDDDHGEGDIDLFALSVLFR